MEERFYVSGMIRKKLEMDFCNTHLLKNPRASEINDIIIEYAEKMGIVGDPSHPLYNSRIQERVNMLLSSPGFLMVTPDANVKLELPTYHDESMIREEKRWYAMIPDFQMKRTIEKKINSQVERIDSIMDTEGIEIQRIICQNEDLSTQIVRERMKQYPQIMVETKRDGSKKYYDLTKSSTFGDLNKEEAKEITKEEIATISKVESIRIAERNKYTAYGKGIAELLGVSSLKEEEERQ